jgi:hypothetical protein
MGGGELVEDGVGPGIRILRERRRSKGTDRVIRACFT